MREVVVEGGNLATETECRADECKRDVSEIDGVLSKGEIFKRETDKAEKEMSADKGKNGDDLETGKILEGEKMGVRVGAEMLFCCDEIGEKFFLQSQTICS